MLGRFSRTGIDVHVNGRCLGDSCQPGPCELEHWKEFQAQMLKIHGVTVPDKYMPKYLRG